MTAPPKDATLPLPDDHEGEDASDPEDSASRETVIATGSPIDEKALTPCQA